MQYIWNKATNEAIEEPDIYKWGTWFAEINNRQVRLFAVAGVQVSTVFLGMDYNYSFLGPPIERIPILWETMIFDSRGHGTRQERYTSYEDAVAGHARAVALVQEEQSKQ